MTMLYRHFDRSGVLLYVGISANALKRAAAHGVKPWGVEISRIEVEHFETRRAALDAEAAAIRAERPRYNIVHNRPATYPQPSSPQPPSGSCRGRPPLAINERLAQRTIRLKPSAWAYVDEIGMRAFRELIASAD